MYMGNPREDMNKYLSELFNQINAYLPFLFG
jgi:hypothetical protein